MTSYVVIFHDETGDYGPSKLKGHILLFVPIQQKVTTKDSLFTAETITYSPLEIFHSRILELREKYKLQKKKFHFTNIGGTKWTEYDLGVRILMQNIVDALRHKRPISFDFPLCFKIAVIVYPKNSDISIYGGINKQEKGLRHKETILRILLKGAAHFLYSDSHKVQIHEIISDGQPDHREMSESRIINQLYLEDFTNRQPLRDYVSFSKDTVITHISSDHKDHNLGTLEHKYSQFLQIADMTIGAGLHSYQNSSRNWKSPPLIGITNINKKEVIAYPFRELLSKTRRGRNFEHSGHFRSFTFTNIDFAEGKVSFSTMGINTSINQEEEFDFQ
jgi:hypothetical protein